MRTTLLLSASLFITTCQNNLSFSLQSTPSHSKVTSELYSEAEDSRRLFFSSSSRAILGLVGITSAFPREAWGSGGATAGKYTTIPIAKRRYYGRVEEAVHEFLLMGPDVVKADMQAASIQTFFDIKAVVIVPAKKGSINGQCTKKDCKGKEIRDSRYNDMKTSMYLLGNAFRYNQQKAPDNLPTVKAAKAFFKEIRLIVIPCLCLNYLCIGMQWRKQ